MPILFVAVGVMLILYGLYLGQALDSIGAIAYPARLVICFLLIAPPAFLMGFPMPIAMTTLGRLGKDHMFVWAWGVNGCFSVIGAAAAPVIATNFGLAAVIEVAASPTYWRFLPFMASSLLTKIEVQGKSKRGLDSSPRRRFRRRRDSI